MNCVSLRLLKKIACNKFILTLNDNFRWSWKNVNQKFSILFVDLRDSNWERTKLLFWSHPTNSNEHRNDTEKFP